MESIDSLYDADRLLDRAFQHCLTLLSPNSDLSEILPVQRHFLRVYACQPLVEIGGLQYFFESDWPGLPPYSELANAFHLIGAAEASSPVSKAVALFSFPDPHLSRLRRVEFLRASCVEPDTEMAVLSSKMMDQSDDVYSKLAVYVGRQSELFGIA
jgi:hypothetical protein